MKTYFGVDYHKKYSHGTIMNEKGKILKQERFLNHRESVNKFIDGYGGDDCLSVLEATRNWTVMHDILEDLTADVTLAHPLKVKAIAEAKIKTDKIDSTTLAHLHAYFHLRAFLTIPIACFSLSISLSAWSSISETRPLISCPAGFERSSVTFCHILFSIENFMIRS